MRIQVQVDSGVSEKKKFIISKNDKHNKYDSFLEAVKAFVAYLDIEGQDDISELSVNITRSKSSLMVQVNALYPHTPHEFTLTFENLSESEMLLVENEVILTLENLDTCEFLQVVTSNAEVLSTTYNLS